MSSDINDRLKDMSGIGEHEALDAKDVPLVLGCLMDDVAEIKSKLDFFVAKFRNGSGRD